MSQESDIILCDRCSFKTSSDCKLGIFLYVFKDGVTINVNRTTGWCYHCKNIVPIEDFPSRKEVLEELKEQYSKYEQLKKRSILSKLINPKKDEIQFIIKNGIELKHQILFLDQRKSPPKCLLCGSENNEKLIIPRPSNKQSIFLNFEHPDCGGKFSVSLSGIRFSYAFKQKKYNIDGIRI